VELKGVGCEDARRMEMLQNRFQWWISALAICFDDVWQGLLQ
jgi:hypothetical protein